MLPRYIGLGLCTINSNLNKLPGWEKQSYGYHADDGCIFNASGSGENYGQPFTTGDVVGCGYNMVDKTVFFTKNGVNLGTAFTGIAVSDIASVLLSMLYNTEFMVNKNCPLCALW